MSEDWDQILSEQMVTDWRRDQRVLDAIGVYVRKRLEGGELSLSGFCRLLNEKLDLGIKEKLLRDFIDRTHPDEWAQLRRQSPKR